jgi:phosphatidylglycerol:prolipoprotein diacylglycerol transferase
VISIVAGAKVMALIETWIEAPERFYSLSVLHSPRMRIPGGFLLAILIGPLTARVIGVPFLRLADAVVPAAGLCIAGIRFGCFLQGCCFGHPSSLPWAISFPPNTPTFWWQIQRGLLEPQASASLPVQPLQLYFALAGIVLSAVLLWYQKRRRYEGQVLLLFVVLYAWSTWALELLRASPHDTTRTTVLIAALCATAITAVVEWQRYPRAPSSKTHIWLRG